MTKQVVVTGEGIVSAIGLDKQSVYESLCANRTGVGKMLFLDSTQRDYPVGEVKLSNEEMKIQLGISSEKLVSRTSLMGIMAVKQALNEAHVIERIKRNGDLRVVLINGTTVGGMDLTEHYFKEMMEKGEHAECLDVHDCGSSTEAIANYFGVFKESTTISTACSSAANAIMLGARMIKDGQADIVVAGGAEALTRFHLDGFRSLMILDKSLCRPFDETRAGLNLGEGAAFVVLESENVAKKKGQAIHAFLSGYGNACDAFHQTASSKDGEGAYLAMKESLDMAGVDVKKVDYINAHGTGTPDNDASESAALKRLFGENLPLISSTKAFTGHATSAAGSIEVVICLLAILRQFVPSNLGWKEKMEDGIIPTMGEKHKSLNYVLCNSFGFGGNDTSLLFTTRATSSREDSLKEVKVKELARVEITSDEDLGEIKQYIKPLEARRLSTIMKSSLLSSLKALEQAGLECPDAIITATSRGCLETSEKILKQLVEEGEDSVKPTYFMQSTHNTIGSTIAIRLKCHGYNATYTHRKKSLEYAMRDAKMLIKTGKCRTVLVGCHDETTPLYRSLMERIGEKNLKPIESLAIVLSCGE